jgi:hypothetical protein
MNSDSISVDVSTMKAISETLDSDPEEASFLLQRANEAKRFVQGFEWCKEIIEQRFAGGFSKIAVFFFSTVNSQATRQSDNEFWVVVGDIPPAILVSDENPNVKEALLSYVYWMREWVEAVKAGKNTKDCIPVDVEPTMEHAQMLESRLDFIEHEYVPSLDE